MNRNLGIDLLRVLSIGIVVLYHYNALGNFSLDGTHAVVIFFMISGYCMGFSTKNRTSSQFLKARLLRLVPPMFICATLSTAIESVFAEIRPDRLHGLKEYASTLICLPSGNLICDLYSNIAYGRAFTYTYVDGAYWSLLVEIRFYILFWFLTYVLRTKQTVLIIAALGILGSVNLMNNVLSESNDFMPYLSFFAFGMSYRAHLDKDRLGTLLLALCPLVFLGTVLLGTHNYAIPFNRSNCLSYIACFAIFACAMAFFNKKTNRIVGFLGLLSYPVYLLHQDIGLILIKISENSFSTTISLSITISIILVLSVFVELLTKKLSSTLHQTNRAKPSGQTSAPIHL